MSTPFRMLLGAITRQRGVLGALVVDEVAGIVVDSRVQHGVEADDVAALAASLYRKARLSAEAAGLGAASLLRIQAESGQILVTGSGALLLVVVAEPKVNVGMLRATMIGAARELVG